MRVGGDAPTFFFLYEKYLPALFKLLPPLGPLLLLKKEEEAAQGGGGEGARGAAVASILVVRT